MEREKESVEEAVEAQAEDSVAVRNQTKQALRMLTQLQRKEYVWHNTVLQKAVARQQQATGVNPLTTRTAQARVSSRCVRCPRLPVSP
jgi:hypothetical protein